MFDQNEPEKKKRWWDRLDGHTMFILSCALLGVLMILKGVIGIIRGE